MMSFGCLSHNPTTWIFADFYPGISETNEITVEARIIRLKSGKWRIIYCGALMDGFPCAVEPSLLTAQQRVFRDYQKQCEIISYKLK